MADPNAYNFDEKDLNLARMLDQVMDSADPTHERAVHGQDPLLPYLDAYKSAVTLKVEDSAGALHWQRIEQGMMKQDEAASVSAERQQSDQIDAQPHPEGHTLSGARPWRQEQPVSRQDGPVPKMTVRWLPLLTRVAALLALAAFMWLLISRQQVPEPELIAGAHTQKQTVTLLDGTSVTLRPHSKLYRIVEVETEQRYEIRGEGYFEVIPIRQRKFVVVTDDARVTVTGTRFSVGTWDNHTRVFLEKGSVLLSLADGSSETPLAPGEEGKVTETSITTFSEVPAETHLGWLNDVLVLDRRPLSSIIRELRHHFNIQVAISPDLVDLELSGTLVLDDPEIILQDVALSAGAILEQPEPGRFLIISTGEN